MVTWTSTVKKGCYADLLPFPLLKISYSESFFLVRVGDTFINGDFPCERNFFSQKAYLYSIFRTSVTSEVLKKNNQLEIMNMPRKHILGWQICSLSAL